MAINIEPQVADTYFIRGAAYHRLDQYERAIENYDEAIRLDPQNTLAYDGRSRAYDDLEATTVYSINQDVIIGTTAKWRVDNAEDKGNLLPKSDSRYSWDPDEKTTTGKFIKVTFTIENLSGETVKWPDKPTLVDNQNRAYDAISGVSQWIPEELHWSSPDLQPDLPEQFVLIYEIPSGATGLSLKVNDLTSSFLSDPETALISLGL